MKTPRVSVCVDVFNYEAFLPQCLASVLEQDLRDFEVVVSDDCSTDGSYEIAQAIAAKDARIRVFRNPKNCGMVANRNACLQRAQGDYVKILHADDFLCSREALTKMADMLDQHPGMSLVTSALHIVNAQGEVVGSQSHFAKSSPLIGTRVITRSLRERKNLIGPPSATMFRRERASRGFDCRFFNSADWEMWFHLLEQGSLGMISDPLVAYRRHDSQQTEKDKLTLSESEDALALLDRYLDKPYVELSTFRKKYLRARAESDLQRRARRLGIPTHVGSQPRWKAALFFLYGQSLGLQSVFAQQSRWRQVPAQARPVGINVVGFFSGEYGIGDSSRAFSQLIKTSGLPAAFLKIPSRNHRNEDRSFTDDSKTNPYSVNLMTFSFDYARRFARDRGKRFFAGRINIGIWFWELATFPAKWHGRFAGYDEIWTCTSFCQQALAAVSPVPVIPIGYPLPVGDVPEADRHGFGLPSDTCLFLFSFDFHSVMERKNPQAVVEAFRKAFGGSKDKACLILKSINAHHYPQQAAQLQHLAQTMNIRWISEHLDGHKMRQLFATADCYVSLHRVEGLGLGMAQSMSFGKPVIATAYSGNMDFTTPTNSRLVDYTLVPIDYDHGAYERGHLWAEANTDHAAEHMKWVCDNRAEAAQLGKKAEQDIRRIFCPQAVLQKIRSRLCASDERFNGL